MAQSKDDATPLWWTAVKLVGCAAIIAAIGFAIAVVDISGSVSESHADISWHSPFDRSNTERLTDALDNLGHDDAARYNLNGNTVFFSTETSRKSPRQVMAEYQEEFRRQGLNDRIYVNLSDEERSERLETALTGGIVPFAITDDKIAMRGVVTANQATDAEELSEIQQAADSRYEIFRGHRYIEISRPNHRRHTSIVATWSDEAFDFERMLPGSEAEGVAYDTTVPACPGCTRLSRFADDDPGGGDRVDLSFIGPRDIATTRQFYAQSLSRSGWQRQSLNEPLRGLERQLGSSLTGAETDRFSRGSEELSLTFTTDERTGHTLTLASLTGS